MPFREAGGSSWRVSRFLGVDAAVPEAACAGARELAQGREGVDLVVLDDAALGFRTQPALWPLALRDMAAPARWVLIKMAAPIAEGGLWEELVERHAERLLVVLTVDDLRLSEVQVSRALSWERTAQDLLSELVHNPRLNGLARCAHIVVSFDTVGSLLLSGGGRCRLFFDPMLVEGMWEREHPGRMIGYTSCLAASLALALLRKPEAPALDVAIQRGIAAMRELHQVGYGAGEFGKRGFELAFPAAPVAAAVVADGSVVAEADVPDPTRLLTQPRSGAGRRGQLPLWRILEVRHPERLEELAERVAREGVDAALGDVPIARFGKLDTVDRQEIEALRSIRNLILEYSAHQRRPRPLSIAVFGPPGAGKSFAIVEVARSVLSERVEKLSFNLSQLNDPRELHGAFHQIRDLAVAGKLPLVFWDEFDCALAGKPLGWLRHFLVPMQDGSFQEGQLTHAIGPAVFVFAGGTSERMAHFAAARTSGFRDAKGPDFVSRLKGFVDVLGPNPVGGNAAADPHHVIRRAILLRSILFDAAPQLFRLRQRDGQLQIDNGVLRALLATSGYRHGARSLESVVAMSQLEEARRLTRSALAPEAQLDLHVDGREFLGLVQAPELAGGLLESLAEMTHVVYCEGMLADGYAWNEPTDEYLLAHERLARFAGAGPRGAPTHRTLVAWQHLCEDDRKQNRDLAREIPHKLVRAGYVILAARGDEPGAFEDADVERLAEQEHERWLWLKLRGGWRYGPVSVAEQRLHEALLSWRRLSLAVKNERYGAYADRIGDHELPEKQKRKDRRLVRGIPDALARAGYTIAKVSAAETSAVVRIGVSGHRILTDLEPLEIGIEAALRWIERRHGGAQLEVVSALAEGADRLVAWHALALRDSRLVAVLPLLPERYLADFERPESKAEFRGLLARADEVVQLSTDANDEAAYDAAGRYVLDHCDVLLTVWDGHDAQGEGGTGAIVALARQRKLPLAWVHAGNRKPGTSEPTSLGREQGTVTFEVPGAGDILAAPSTDHGPEDTLMPAITRARSVRCRANPFETEPDGSVRGAWGYESADEIAIRNQVSQ